MSGDLAICFTQTSIIQVIRSVNHPLLATLVDKWTRPLLSPMFSAATFPLTNGTFSFTVALKVLEAFVKDAFRAETVAGYFDTRQSQIKRVWDNTKIECGICDYVQIAFSAGISPDMVEGVFEMFSDVDCLSGVCSGAAIAKIASEFFVEVSRSVSPVRAATVQTRAL